MTWPTREAPSDAMPRKRYAKPRLHVYGDLSGLTRAVTNMGAMDGAKAKGHGTRLPPGMSGG